MNRLVYALLLLLFVGFVTACGPNIVTGSGNVTSEARNVSGFGEVLLHGIGMLTIEQSDRESLTIEAEDNILPLIKSDVSNGKLTLGPERLMSINPTRPIKFTLTVQNLNALELSGSANMTAANINTEQLRINLGGVGDLTISGKVVSQDVAISGAGGYHAENLESQRANLRLSGAGSAKVRVAESLDVQVSGASTVEYIGRPRVNQQVAGAGLVRQVGDR